MAAVASAAMPAQPAPATSTNLSSRTSTTALPSAAGAPPHHTPPHSLSSTSSPSSSSPTSPQQHVSAFAKRPPVPLSARPAQIGRPKNVGFVPAALRPTERPRTRNDFPQGAGHAKAHSIAGTRSGPPTPPRSLHNSTDNLAGAGAAAAKANALNASSRKSSDSSHSSHTLTNKLTPIEIPANAGHHDGPASARPSTRGSGLVSSPTASISSLSLSSMIPKQQQAQHPTKAHWRPDAMISKCEYSVCPTTFGTFTRRHHCRRCGGIFCYKHVARTVPLDTNACMVPTPLSSAPSSNPTTPKLMQGNGLVTPEEPEGSTEIGWWRVCDGCHGEWVNWVEGLHEQEQTAARAGKDFRLPMDAPVPVQRKTSLAGSLSGSVSNAWNWSTF